MTVDYTWDIFCTLDGFGSYNEDGDWGGFWSKEGPEFLDGRRAAYDPSRRLVLGANTFRQIVRFMGPETGELSDLDDVMTLMRDMPVTVISSSLEEPLDWPDATLVSGDAVEVVARMKEESDVALRSHGSVAMNLALMAAGLVDRVQVSVFPVISGRTGTDPIFGGADDFDLELVESRLHDGRIQELVYRPTLHG